MPPSEPPVEAPPRTESETAPASLPIGARLAGLRQAHRDLDAMIDGLVLERCGDQLMLTRLKKRKLQLKDAITYFESRMIPDLDA